MMRICVLILFVYFLAIFCPSSDSAEKRKGKDCHYYDVRCSSDKHCKSGCLPENCLATKCEANVCVCKELGLKLLCNPNSMISCSSGQKCKRFGWLIGRGICIDNTQSLEEESTECPDFPDITGTLNFTIKPRPTGSSYQVPGQKGERNTYCALEGGFCDEYPCCESGLTCVNDICEKDTV